MKALTDTSSTGATADERSRTIAFGFASVLLLITLLWSYAPTILPMVRDWRSDENYSAGQLVPLAALYLLWIDRKKLAFWTPRPCWWGIGIIILAQLARMFGLIEMYESAERYALVLTIVGLVMLVAGWEIFWRARWILLFLFLMVPLPGQVHNLISGPLQNLATVGAVTTLELIGISVTHEGNVMVLNDSVPVAVAEACSGLRMLTAFVMVGAVLAYVVNRPRWQKTVLVISSVPVAVVCNLIRLVVTAILFLMISNTVAETFFHDFAGWTMMPLAFFILLGEMWIMNRLIIEDESEPDKTPV